MLPKLLAALGATSLLAIGACADLAGADVDCEGSLVNEYGFCVAEGANQLEIEIRILPPATSGYVEKQVPVRSIAQSSALVANLDVPVTVRGTVQIGQGSFVQGVPGELEARAPGAIPGHPYVFSTQTRHGSDEFGHNYELSLQSGLDYEVTFRPDWEQTPTYTFTLTEADLDKGRKDITLPEERVTTKISGTVTLPGHGALAFASVRAFSPDGASSATETDEDGSFETFLPPGTHEVRFRVQRPEDGPLFPTYETDYMTVVPNLPIPLPELPDGMSEFAAVVRVVGAAGEPLPYLPVTLKGAIAWGTLRLEATTDEQGQAHFDALPGSYECLVETDAKNPHANWQGDVCLGALSDAKAADGDGCALDPSRPPAEQAIPEIALEQRALLTGDVLESTGHVLPSGTVMATRKSENADDALLVASPPPFNAEISVDGRFEMLVDPGRYDIRITPGEDVGAPPLNLKDQAFETSTELGVIKLPAPDLLRLAVRGAEDEELADVTVEIYVPNGTSQLLVAGTTDEHGIADLIVPFEP